MSDNIARFIGGNEGDRRILGNIGWLFFGKIIRLGLGLTVGIWLARYLGPEHFGSLNYAIALVAIFLPLATMGLQGVVVKALVENPAEQRTILGSAVSIMSLSSVCAFVVLMLGMKGINPGQGITGILTVILGISLLFKPVDVIRYWFESQVLSKYTVWVESGVIVISALIKIVLILAQVSVVAFAWVILLESFLISIGLVIFYAKYAVKKGIWRATLHRVKELSSKSWPLVISGFAIMIYMRIDQVMIGKMLGDEAVGLYSAALQISEVWYMVPTFIAASLFPSILETRQKNYLLYRMKIQRLMNLMVAFSLVIAVTFTVLSDWVIVILYGVAYQQSAEVLLIHVWSNIFVFIGIVAGKWYLAENLQRLNLYRTLAGAGINIILNFMLIPAFGIIGAAIATIIAQSFSAYFADVMSEKTRVIFYVKTRSIFGGFMNLKRY